MLKLREEFIGGTIGSYNEDEWLSRKERGDACGRVSEHENREFKNNSTLF